MNSSEVEQKIMARVYPRHGVAKAVIKRGKFSKATKTKLLELAEKAYAVQEEQPDADTLVDSAVKHIDTVSAYPVIGDEHFYGAGSAAAKLLREPMIHHERAVVSDREVDSDWSARVNAKLSEDKLERQLLRIAFNLLGLCVEYKLSREEIYARLDKTLRAGMG